MRLVRRKRGVSGIISGLFLVAVSMMIFSMSYWQIMQQDHYSQVMLGRMQRDWDRFNERVIISEYLNVGTASYLRLKIRNIGAVPANIVTAYLNDTTANIPRSLLLANYITANCSTWVSAGTEKWINTTISLTSGNLYDLKIATERGNTGIYLKLQGGTSAGQVPGGAQPMPFTFSFQVTDFQYIYGTQGWSSARAAWILNQGSGKFVLRLKVKNTYETIARLQSASVLNYLYIYTGKINPGQRPSPHITYRCYILAPGSTPSSPQVFNSQSFAPGEENYVYFGSDEELKTTINTLDSGENGDFYVFATVFYKLDGDPTNTIFGATISVISCTQAI